MDCSPAGSSVHRILQARILEWVVIPFSRRSSWLRDLTQVSCTAGRFFTIWAAGEALSIWYLELFFLELQAVTYSLRSVLQGTNFFHQSRTAVLKQDDFAQLPPLPHAHTHSCTNSWDPWQCFKILLVVQLVGGGLLGTYSGQRPGMLLNILQCTGQPSQQRIIWLKMSIMMS